MKYQKTKGIVLNQLKYSETSLIINVLTEDFGKMSFIVNGVRKRKSKFPANYFQAFNILQIVFIESSKSDLHRITEVSNAVLLNDIIFDIHKSSICMFLAELIHLSYKSSEKDEQLFQFLEHLIQYIDSSSNKGIANIHLWTLLRLMQFSGISPYNNYSADNKYFNPVEACFTTSRAKDSLTYSSSISEKIRLLLASEIETCSEIELKTKERQILLNKMIEYFQLHLDRFKPSKSLKILSEVFAN